MIEWQHIYHLRVGGERSAPPGTACVRMDERVRGGGL